MRRNPNILTAHFASGGRLDGEEGAWVAHNLARLRAFKSRSSASGASPSLVDLNNIYMGARIIQGSVVSSRLALPTMIRASMTLRALSLPEGLNQLSAVGSVETERFLSGSENGRPRQGNDFPAPIKSYIAGIAGLLAGAYEQAYQALEQERPELLTLGWEADELQRLTWGLIRSRISKVVSTEEVASHRLRPLRKGSEELLTLVKERTGVQFPARVMQRDNWVEALENPRQEPRVALFNAMKFFVENAEVALLYCLGSLLARLKLGSNGEVTLRDQVRSGAQEIAAGTRTVTHRARFQSRIGARPNDYRSFREFLSNVRGQVACASLQSDGTIRWADTLSVRGWCPAQNSYEPKSAGGGLTDLARDGRAAVEAWKVYGQEKFGVAPIFINASPGELIGAIVVFATMHESSVLRPESRLVQEIASQL